jgi:hypothetical protein
MILVYRIRILPDQGLILGGGAYWKRSPGASAGTLAALELVFEEVPPEPEVDAEDAPAAALAAAVVPFKF